MVSGLWLIGWISIGASAGWIGSNLMGDDDVQAGVPNAILGIIGAVVGGAVTEKILGDNPGNTGGLASLVMALFGSGILISGWRSLSRRRA